MTGQHTWEYLEHCFPVFLLELMVLLTMLYPGEPSRAVESDKVCTCFTGLLDVCVQALAMQLHALIRITSMMSCLFLADIPGHNQMLCEIPPPYLEGTVSPDLFDY